MNSGKEGPTIDGWTRIVRGKKSRAATVNIANPPSQDLTINDIQRNFDLKKNLWKESQCRLRVLRILKRARPETGWRFRNAVCLATGSFCRDNLQCRQRSMWQFVFFMDLVGYFQEDCASDFEVVVQDPQYLPLDHEFLVHLGIKSTEIENPTKTASDFGPAKRYLGHDSFLFEPFLDATEGMLKDMFEADLMLYIGSSIPNRLSHGSSPTNVSDTSRSPDSASQLALGFHETHQMCRFPNFDVDPNIFEGIYVIWKSETEDDP